MLVFLYVMIEGLQCISMLPALLSCKVLVFVALRKFLTAFIYKKKGRLKTNIWIRFETYSMQLIISGRRSRVKFPAKTKLAKKYLPGPPSGGRSKQNHMKKIFMQM